MKFEIKIRSARWYEVSYYTFRSWTGPRRIDGKEYHGKVYKLGEGMPNPSTPKDVDQAAERELVNG